MPGFPPDLKAESLIPITFQKEESQISSQCSKNEETKENCQAKP